MANLEIIGVPPSTYTRVVRMCCEEKGVPYNFKIAAPHTPDIDVIHPFGKVPVMRHGGVELCESRAIAGYIDRNFGGAKLIPDDPAKAAEVEQWISMINTVIDPTMIRQYVLGYVLAKDGKPDRAALDGAVETMKPQIGVLDKAVAGGHLAGGGFTLADIFLMPILFYLPKFPEGAELMKAARNVSAYFDRHSKRPSFEKTAPPPP